jgi:hypothetical protein
MIVFSNETRDASFLHGKVALWSDRKAIQNSSSSFSAFWEIKSEELGTEEEEKGISLKYSGGKRKGSERRERRNL